MSIENCVVDEFENISMYVRDVIFGDASPSLNLTNYPVKINKLSIEFIDLKS